MDVVYAIVEGLQFFIPIVAIVTLLAVLWHYKGQLDGGDAESSFDELNFDGDEINAGMASRQAEIEKKDS